MVDKGISEGQIQAMKYPSCKDDSCVFEEAGTCKTLMYSPIQYDRYGAPVGGGGNRVTRIVKCVTHNEYFESKQTELEDAQGKERTWTDLSELGSELVKSEQMKWKP